MESGTTGVIKVELFFIINEQAGNGKGKKVWEKLRKELHTPFSFYITNHHGHATTIARKIASNFQLTGQKILLIAVGGDGTIHEVVNGVIGFNHVYVGAIGAGSGNDFSREYFTFHTAYEIDEFIKGNEQSLQQFDSGMVKWSTGQSIHFVNNSGIGFDAFVAKLANHSTIKKRLNKMGLGKFSYVYFVLLGLFTFKLFTLTVEQNGSQRKYEKVWFATVSNQPYFGGGMKISPQSDPMDGKLELTIVYNLSRLKLLLMFVTVFFGSHTRLQEVVQQKGDQFTLYINDELPCHADGEVMGVTKNNSRIDYVVQKKSWMSIKRNSEFMKK